MGVIHIGRTLVRAVIRRWRGSGHEASACNAHATVIDYCVGWVARYGPHRFVSWTPNVPSTTGISARRWKRLRRFFGGRWGLRLCLGFGFPFALLTTLGTSIFKPNLCDGNHHQLSLLTCEISLELHLFHITLWSLPEAAFSRQTSKLEFTCCQDTNSLIYPFCSLFTDFLFLILFIACLFTKWLRSRRV